MKRTLTILLSICLLMTVLLVGCNKTVDSDNKVDAEPKATEASEAKATEETEPTETEPTVITAIINVNNTMTLQPSEMPSFQRWFEETGITMEFEVVRSDWESRKNLVLASDDIPDTFWGNRTIGLADLTSNLDVFVPLNDYIDNSINIKAMFEEEPTMKNMVTFPDGTIYSLPHRMPLRPDSFHGNYINQTWLDKLGLDMPTTLDEFTETLRAFKNDDPNGNGIADEIPWSWSGTSSSFGFYWLFGSFGLANNVMDRFAMEDGKAIYIPVTDAFRDGIKYMSGLYAEGLIDPEVFTQNWSIWLPKCQQTDPTIMGVSGMWTINTLMGNANGPNYTTMPPLVGPSGEQPVYPSNPTYLRSGQVTWTLTTSCENPDAAFKFIDHVYEPKQSVQLYFGSYGVGTREEADGTISVTDPTDPDVTYDQHLWTNGFGDMGPYYVSKSFEKNMNPNAWVTEKAEIDAVYQPYLVDEVAPIVIYSEEDNEELATLKTDILNVVNAKIAAWVTGESNIDDEWDDYISTLNNIGFERYMEIINNRIAEVSK